MVIVKFHKLLYKYTNNIKSHELDISSFDALFKSLKTLFPDLQHYITSNSDLLMIVDNNNKVINDVDIIKDKFVNITKLSIVPCIYGSGKGFKKIAIGAALIAASFAIGTSGGLGFSSALKSPLFNAAGAPQFLALATRGLFGLGVNLILGSLLESFAPKPKLEEPTLDSKEQRRNNDMFDGIVNTIDSSQSVGLHYGYLRVGGQLISGYIKSVNHTKNDNILISNYV